MAFSFGAAPAAAAPAPAASSGFSFGGTPAAGAPTPAPATGGGLFGAPAPAPAGGGLFGAPAPKPASGGLFGSTPAPAPAGGGLFGAPAPAAPAPAGGGLFGSTPAPAPAAGGLFGSTAPAPAAGGLFGSTPAPASGGLFGSTPAPAPATGGLFGAPAPAAVQPMAQQQMMQQPFSCNTPYSQLPDNAKRAVDQIYQLMMQHRRTLASVKTMAPSLLVVENAAQEGSGSVRGGAETPSPADAAAGSPRRTSQSNKANVDAENEPLPQQMVALQSQIQTLLQSAETNLAEAQQLKSRAGEMAVQAKMHGAWPIENVAARRGVALSSIKGLLNDATANAQSTTGTLGGPVPVGGSGGTPASCINMSGMTNIDAIALQQIMDIRAKHVDRIESMPSPYFWEVLHNFEERVNMAQRDVEAVRARLAIAEEAERVRGASGGMMMGGDMTSLMIYDGGNGPSAPLSKRLATLAVSHYDRFLTISSEASRAHDAVDEMKQRYQRFYQNTKGGYYEDPFKKADTEAIGREREMQQRIMAEQIATASPPKATSAAPAPPAAGGGLFGAPAPAPAGGLFGAPAPAPASGGLFGAPAPKPASGGLFGSTPAPAPAGGGLFGAPAPAPAGGGLFGSTPAPAPAAGGLFGSTPAPAPAAGGGLFGSAPAPAPVFGAAPTTPASTLAPRKKSGGRSSGRRR